MAGTSSTTAATGTVTTTTPAISAAVSISFQDLVIEEKPLMSDEFREMAERILLMAMLPLNILGVITNVINSRVFVEQGLRNDSTTIGLLTLAIADLFGCLTMIPYSLCYLVGFFQDIPTQYTCLAYATLFCYAHIVFSQTSAWVTVYISVERSLCVVIPMSVRRIFTPKLAGFVIVFIFLFFLVDELLYAVNTVIVWTFFPAFNRSIAVNYDNDFARDFLLVNSILTNTVMSSLAIVIVVITTTIMVNKLIQVKKWRQGNANTTAEGQKHMSSKDVEVIKSVTVVTVIFLVCLSMSHIPSSAYLAVPGVSFAGINRNLYFFVYMVRFLFDAINASINFFFYIKISSRYKAAFSAVYPKCTVGQAAKTKD